MDFKPDVEKKVLPYFDDVNSSQGWEGHTTTKTVEKLIAEISANLALVNCVYSGTQSGSFGDRYGFQIHFSLKSAGGDYVAARMDVACLPLKRKRTRGAQDPRIEATKKWRYI